MPFTLSHAAAVLPLRRTRLPFSALIIGSFGPDFEYFLRMNYGSRIWHSYPYFLTYCLPFCLLAYFVFHSVVRHPVIELLPEPIRIRMSPGSSFPSRSPAEFAAVIAALVLGVLTHLFWDSFTHASTWPWAHIAALRGRYEFPFFGWQYGFAIAQGFSSALGLVLLATALWLWLGHTQPQPALSRPRSPETKGIVAFGFLIIAIAGAFWRTVYVMGPRYALRLGSLSRLLLVIAGIGCFLWELLAYGIVVTLWHKRKEAHR